MQSWEKGKQQNSGCAYDNDGVIVLPEAAVTEEVSITGVAAKRGVLVTDAAPWKFIFITVWQLVSHSSSWNPTLRCRYLNTSTDSILFPLTVWIIYGFVFWLFFFFLPVSLNFFSSLCSSVHSVLKVYCSHWPHPVQLPLRAGAKIRKRNISKHVCSLH